MSLDRAREHLKNKGYEDRIIITEHSSATVSEAATALGCEPDMICKTLSFLQGEQPVLILVSGSVLISCLVIELADPDTTIPGFISQPHKGICD